MTARLRFLCAAVCALLLVPAGSRGPARSSPPQAASIDLQALQPLRFEQNLGQTDPHVRFMARSGSSTLFLSDTEAVLALEGRGVPEQPGTPRGGSPEAVIRLRPMGDGSPPWVLGLDPLPGNSHYLVGSDPGRWRSGVKAFGAVRYEGVRPGIDLIFHGRLGRLEYDFEVAPGAEPDDIGIAIEGADRVRLGKDGDLVLGTPVGDVVFRSPIAYQVVGAKREEVPVRHVLGPGGQVAFRVGAYDRSRPLLIDPVLTYSTYLGGADTENSFSIAADASGNLYVTGQTRSADFPVKNALQPVYIGTYPSQDVFVTKISGVDGSLIYSTFFGGTGEDEGYGIAVDGGGGVFLAGYTCSSNFPTLNPVQASQAGGCDAFVTRLAPDGASVVYSTYLGGSAVDLAQGIAIDSVGNAYVAGWGSSGDFPLVRPLQPTCSGSGENAFVASLPPTGSPLRYSTCLGGSGEDRAVAIAVDSAGSALVCGSTSSINFPVRNPLRPIYGGGYRDGYLAKLAPDGTSLVFSTYLGGSDYDFATAVAVDPQGAVYVTGGTYSTDFPMTRALQPTRAGDYDAFVSALEPSGGAFLYSTFLGGTRYDSSFGIGVDASGSVTIAGSTQSADFPLVKPLQEALRGSGDDVFVARLRPDGGALLYSTFIGGSGGDYASGLAVLSGGGVALTGETKSSDFPLVRPFQSTPALCCYEAFVARLYPLDLLLTRTRTGLEWNRVPGAFGYDVVSGDLSSLRRTGGDFTASVLSCLADDYPRAYLLDPADPPLGEAFWYLVRSVGETTSGTYDSGDAAQVAPRDARIDASPVSCARPPTPHAIIDISGNAGFTQANGVVGGGGTPDDPFRIENWDIDATGSNTGLAIRGSDATFVIRNVRVHGALGTGVVLDGAANGTLERVRCTDNLHGLFVSLSSHIVVQESVFASHPDGRGVSVSQSADVTLVGNDVTDNLAGVVLTGSTGAFVHHNNLLSNVLQASDDGGASNAWDAGYPAGGNYWTNFQGADLCSGPGQDVCPGADGLGDTPYLLDTDSVDRYPLMILPGSSTDDLPPLVAIMTPVRGDVINTLSTTITGSASDADSGLRRVEVRVDDGPWMIANGTSSWNATVALHPGYDVVQARSWDHAGNVSAVQPAVTVIQLNPTAAVTIVTDKDVYRPGETVQLAVVTSNLGSAPLTLDFTSTCQSFFSVQSFGVTIYNIRNHIVCFAAETSYTLQPGQSKADLWQWKQIYDNGSQVPFPADYLTRGLVPSTPALPEGFKTISIMP